jgi:hypothetical protein
VLLIALGAWVIQQCDLRCVFRALLLATVATLLVGVVGAVVLASVGVLLLLSGRSPDFPQGRLGPMTHLTFG